MRHTPHSTGTGQLVEAILATAAAVGDRKRAAQVIEPLLQELRHKLRTSSLPGPGFITTYAPPPVGTVDDVRRAALSRCRS